MQLPPAQQWIAWVASTIAAAVTLTAFAYSNFDTKDQAKDRSAFFEKRLERVEIKEDQIIEILLKKK